ncbi:MAG: AbrB/MazE/SpoVT family DNA-binding domain-containing protein [Stagnimonas sp.]|nr:AbrB/MazE/SpoVT family DNA-binding domain-containing protein [Stagnimonas sp.]
MTTAAITSKNQLTLPKEVRTQLGVGAGDTVVFESQADGSFKVRAQKSRDWRELVGCLNHLVKKGDKPMTVEDMRSTIGQHLAEDDRRISRGK